MVGPQLDTAFSELYWKAESRVIASDLIGSLEMKFLNKMFLSEWS